MNVEKIGYSFVGSLIAGSVIQKNMGLEQQYFFIISVGLWVICIGVQWCNYKREQRIRDNLESSNLESRDAIVNRILEIISETSEREIACIKESVYKLDKELIEVSRINKEIMDTVPTAIATNENNIILNIRKESDDWQKLIEDKCTNAVTLLNKIFESNNGVVDSIKKIENVSVENKDCVCNEIRILKELVDGKQRDAIDQIIVLKDEVKTSKEVVKGTIKNGQETILTNLSELMRLLNSINEDTKSNISKISKDLCGVLCNLQSELEETNSKISEIQNVDSSMFGLLEDTNNKFQDVESSIGDGTERIEQAVEHSMDRQKEIVTEEQNILDSYNELLSRINDEVIVKMVNDSNTLLKCMKDCYNLLDSQRRAKK